MFIYLFIYLFTYLFIFFNLKVYGLISQNGDIYLNGAPSPKKSWFKISVKSVEPFRYEKRLLILQLPTLPCELIMVTITLLVTFSLISPKRYTFQL